MLSWPRAAVHAGFALLAGCAALAPTPEIPSGRPPRGEIFRFQLDGRVAVRNGNESFSARIDWRHDGVEGDRMLITTPLGQGLAELASDPDGARLETADRRQLAAADLDSLSEQVFGAPLPLSRLPRWIVGDAGAGAADLSLDALGRPLGFAAEGWTVTFPAYESSAAAALPSLIQLRRDGLDVRLKVDRWNLAP